VAQASFALLLTCCCALPAPLTAQAEQITAAIQAADIHDLAAARAHLEAAIRHDPDSYEANWRLALVLIDIGKQIPDSRKSLTRDSLYARAESYAHRAVAAKPAGAEGHFAVADAVGRAALSKGPKERVRRAVLVRAEALKTIELDPHHDGAWHILGRWNAEVVRLPALEKFLAKAFLGASVFSAASWDEAERDLRLAVLYAPTKIVHRLDLAEVLVSRKEWPAAKQELYVIATLPLVDVSDTSYKRQGRELMRKVMEKLHR
jgi:hypothetical protein